MTASSPAHVAARFPAYGGQDFFVSGFARGESELGGTAAVIDEPVGTGRVVLFSTDPNFRAWTVGMQKMLRNAVLGDDASAPAPRRAPVHRRERPRSGPPRTRPRRSPRSSRRCASAWTRRASTSARAVLARHGASYTLRPSANKATFLIANPTGLTGRRPPVRGDAARRSTRRRRSRPRISSAVAKPARGPVHMPNRAVASSALRARRRSTTRRSEWTTRARAAARAYTPAFARGKRERRGAPAWDAGSKIVARRWPTSSARGVRGRRRGSPRDRCLAGRWRWCRGWCARAGVG